MPKLKEFGSDADMRTLTSLDSVIGGLEELICNEEGRGDISASDPTPRGRRLNKAYDALTLLNELL